VEVAFVARFRSVERSAIVGPCQLVHANAARSQLRLSRLGTAALSIRKTWREVDPRPDSELRVHA
jgi:hypothetical protein